MPYPLQNPGAKHFADRYLGVTTVGVTVNAESTNTIAVDLQLEDVFGNSVSSADAWEAYVVGEPAADYTVAETGDGTPLSVTAHTGIAFTFSAAGAAQITVTDVSGASNESVILAIRPLDSLGIPAYATCTFD